MRFAFWLLILLVMPGVGVPNAIVAAKAASETSAPAEEDDCGETTKVPALPQRQRHEKSRVLHRVPVGQSAAADYLQHTRTQNWRCTSTAFLAANSPILC